MKTILSRVLALLFFTALAHPAQAAPGDLDTSFGYFGTLTTDFNGDQDGGYSMAIQSDGKIVVVGSTEDGADTKISLARYNPDGSLDTTFNGTGKVTTAFGSDGESWGSGVAIDSLGRIVVAGSYLSGTEYRFAVGRYHGNSSTGAPGTLDTSFGGGDGKVGINIGSGDDFAASVVIQSNNGKIVVAGTSNNGSDNDFALVRLNTDGALDTGFSGDGIVTNDLSGGSDDTCESVAIQSDGKIVMAGRYIQAGVYRFAVARYHGNTGTGAPGSPDTSFDGNGKVGTIVDTEAEARSVAIQSDGKILVAGSSYNETTYYDFALLRYNANGSLDSSFNGTGKVNTDFNGNYDRAWSVAIQSDGRIVVAGRSGGLGLAVARYSANGSLDTTFNFDGKQTTAFDGNLTIARGVAIQGDGKIVAAGYTFTDGGIFGSSIYNDFALARYLGDEPPVVTSSAATSITPNGATLNGTVNPKGLVTTAQFQYGLSSAYGSTAGVTLSPNNGNSAQAKSANLTGLIGGLRYHYRLTATNSAGTSETTNGTFFTAGSLDLNFATAGSVPLTSNGFTATGQMECL